MTMSKGKALQWTLATLVILLVLGAATVVWLLWFSTGRSLDGVWKATDEYGHEHYFEFRRDGTFRMWDRDRSHDGSFTQRGPFEGSYRFLNGNTVEATTGWNGYRAALEVLSEGMLKHEHSFGMRSGLTFQRMKSD